MIKPNTKLSVIVAFFVTVATASIALAGDVDVRGATSTNILDVQNTSTALVDRVAVYGKSAPAAYYGAGGSFVGGYLGVKGVATTSGTGGRIGVWGEASGGASSNVGVYGSASGGTANYAGYFYGNVYISGTLINPPSDETLKDEIVDLEGSLEQVMELKPKSFRYRTEDFPEMNLANGYHMGLLAQELEQVIPELVTEVPVPEREADKGQNQEPKTFLAANYIELIPVLIRAIQEQQEQIATLQVEVAKLKAR